MANYNFTCNKCGDEKLISMSISEFSKWKECDDNFICQKCTYGKLIREFEASSSKVSKDKGQLLQEIKDEVRRTAERVRMGDASAIRDIYGEK
jgi:DNA-directed RNA polymerase subunit M/transcription elongation factor TFIIS